MSLLDDKIRRLRSLISEMDGVVVGYSGGVDSTLLGFIATDVLGERAVCVLASSETYPSIEVREAVDLAKELNLNLVKIETDELKNENFAQNTPERCFFCKTELFTKLFTIAKEHSIGWVADGANVDDLDDYRPGSLAASKLGVRSLLRESGFTKSDIRDAARQLGLPNWDKPSFACLSSRIPYGVRIEPEILARLGEAEQFLKKLGFRQVRVRHHDTIARIEVEPEEIVKLADPEVRKIVTEKFNNLGYTYTALDLCGYKTGSMNAVLEDKEIYER